MTKVRYFLHGYNVFTQTAGPKPYLDRIIKVYGVEFVITSMSFKKHYEEEWYDCDIVRFHRCTVTVTPL